MHTLVFTLCAYIDGFSWDLNKRISHGVKGHLVVTGGHCPDTVKICISTHSVCIHEH